MWNNFLNELIKKGVDCFSEPHVGGPQFHVWIPEQPTEKKITTSLKCSKTVTYKFFKALCYELSLGF